MNPGEAAPERSANPISSSTNPGDSRLAGRGTFWSRALRPSGAVEAGRWWGWPAIVVMSLAATVLSWRPYAWRTVAPGLDPSWQAGLAEGFVRHVQWGPSLVFTFGPYGLVDNILPFYRVTALLAVCYAVVVTWGLSALIISALRPSWGLLGAGVVAWTAVTIAASRTGFSDLASGTALALALAVLQAGGDKARYVLLGLLGALAGFQLLVKINDGLLSLGLVAVLVVFVGAPRGKAVVVAGAPLIAVALVAWVAAGQSVGHLPSYVRGSLSVAIGYSSAMGIADGRVAEDWFGVVAVVLLALVFALAVREKGRRQQFATAVVLAGWVWASVKEGFVRHDAHDLTFFGLMLVGLGLARLTRYRVLVQAGALAAAALMACIAAGGPPEQLHSPGASTVAFADDVRAVLGLGGFGRAQGELRDQLINTGNRLAPSTLSLLYGQSVAFEPAQAAIAYVYPRLNWDPEPVLQGYSAYTSYLDQLDATFLASVRAPERVVYQPGEVIDDRDEWLDPPATLESMYCHYVQLAVSGPSQVLERAPGRCGRPVALERVKTHFGEAVSVPRDPGYMVTATFSFSVPVSSEVAGVLLKPPAMSLSVWTGGAGPSTYRFVPGTADDPHVVSVPSDLGYSPDFTPPGVRKLSVSGGGWAKGHGDVTMIFYARRLRSA